MVSDIVKHLISRDLDVYKSNVIIDEENCLAYFLLYNLSGQLIGYQRYNPNGSKTNHSNNLSNGEMKYYTWVTKIDKIPMIAVYGLETYKIKIPYLFLTEGVFDCIKIHNLNLPAIAVIGNNPKPLYSWLKTLPQIKLSILDNDNAGNFLKRFSEYSFKVPIEFKDLGEMPMDKVNIFINTIINKYNVSE